MLINRERDLAIDFILHTQKSIFLTGKAGTGKTTLLREIIKSTTKRHAVVAPTGVAAVNAKGVTIHSFFQLPTSAIVPTYDKIEGDNIINRSVLTQNQKLRQEKRQLLIEIELLIIDEISMVRADLLDSIDFTLRKVRKSSRPFGGVQFLVIGDLFQLAPIVKPDEWQVLSQYYNSPFFFESMGWKELNAISIELKTVYRQVDEDFVNVLNRIRNGISKSEDIDVLNKRYDANVKTDEVITLTTHNRKAEAINESELKKIDAKDVKLKATVSGHFAPSAYPAKEVLQLKAGAQVMFVKNHPEGLYYNGKLGTIERIKDDIITVYLIEDDTTIEVAQEEWKNTKYVVDPHTKDIVQEEIGSFRQYPFRLAWAITVHKSQGLTFEDVILDLENTFAPGQLYVALSRCRSLEGITLSSKINPHNVIVDQRVVAYYSALQLDEHIDDLLLKEKEAYERQLLLDSFAIKRVILQAEEWDDYVDEHEIPDEHEVLLIVKKITKILKRLEEVSSKFIAQIHALEKEGAELSIIRERYVSAIDYFTTQIHDSVIVHLEKHNAIWKRKAGTKKYTYNTQDLIAECWRYVRQLYSLTLNEKALYQGEHKYNQVVLFDPDRKRKKKKRVVGETYAISHDLFKQGLSISEIAEKRQLNVSTIESHMTRLLKEDKVKITDLLSKKRYQELSMAIGDRIDESSKDIKESISIVASYPEIAWMKHALRNYD